ncbi:MAG: hypothetical protein ACRCYX_12150 [Dermatophilaceae bacterium]
MAVDGSAELHPAYAYAADFPDCVTAAQWRSFTSTAVEVVSIITRAEETTQSLIDAAAR